MTFQYLQNILNIEASSNKFASTAPLSVYNEEKLIGKAQLDFSDKNNELITVPLPVNTSIKGNVQITGSGLTYDNIRYFSINKPKRTKILAIGNTDATFLQKIYTKDEFDFTNANLSNLNYAQISEVNTVIINELNEIPKPLENNLKTFIDNGGVIIIIPSSEIKSSYKEFLNGYNIQFGKLNKTEKKLTHISFEHPVFTDVFTKKIDDFQYPTTYESYNLQGEQNILLLEDNSPFLTQKNNIYVFASALNSTATNFKQSPIIVPCLYNIAKQNSSVSKIDYTIGKTNEINILSSQQSQEDVLQLKGDQEQFIPLQQIYKDYVHITTSNLPKTAGNYDVHNENQILNTLSFNYPTKESVFNYAQISDNEKLVLTNSVSEYFSASKAGFEITELWKWFLIFALIFIGIEILLLKFLK